MGSKEVKNSSGSEEHEPQQEQERKKESIALAQQLEALSVKEEEKAPASLQQLARLIQTNQAKNILVLSGAGVSCSAGIPDFRSPGTGLYDNLQKYNLPYPEAVFDLNFYRTNPQPFLNLAKALWPGLTHSPTLTHSFLALLHKKGKLLRNYSQNIDGLEFLAHLPNDKLVECHGHFRTASCIECGAVNTSLCQQVILETNETPTCDKCGGHVKPDIVFFGEDLPLRFHTLLPTDIKKADLLLVMGTSLQVAPVSLVPEMVKCKRILVNREVVGNFHSKRDLIYTGDCDEAVLVLSKLLGWHDELLELNESTKIKATNDSKEKVSNGDEYNGKEKGVKGEEKGAKNKQED